MLARRRVPQSPLQASKAFLDDVVESQVRWGPLLAYAFCHGCRFQQAPGLGYLEPVIDLPLYQQIAGDALAGLRLWLPRLGVQPIAR